MAKSTNTREPFLAALADPAFSRAAEKIADEAEDIAKQIERGELPACNGSTALRLFAAFLRACNITDNGGGVLVTFSGRC